MTYFDQIDTINDTFDKSSVNKRTEIIFETVLGKNDFRPTTKFTPMTSFWPPK